MISEYRPIPQKADSFVDRAKKRFFAQKSIFLAIRLNTIFWAKIDIFKVISKYRPFSRKVVVVSVRIHSRAKTKKYKIPGISAYYIY